METTIKIKNIIGDIIYQHTAEDNSIKKTVEAAVAEEISLRSAILRSADLIGANLSKAKLMGANLRGANLRGADLRAANLYGARLSAANLYGADLNGANLYEANLFEANLFGANLMGADLKGADLSAANLSEATTDKRYIQIGCIGSAKRMTTYCFDDNMVWSGCFKGTLDGFREAVIERHSNNPKHLKEYLEAIDYIKSLSEEEEETDHETEN